MVVVFSGKKTWLLFALPLVVVAVIALMTVQVNAKMTKSQQYLRQIQRMPAVFAQLADLQPLLTADNSAQIAHKQQLLAQLQEELAALDADLRGSNDYYRLWVGFERLDSCRSDIQKWYDKDVLPQRALMAERAELVPLAVRVGAQMQQRLSVQRADIERLASAALAEWVDDVLTASSVMQNASAQPGFSYRQSASHVSLMHLSKSAIGLLSHLKRSQPGNVTPAIEALLVDMAGLLRIASGIESKGSAYAYWLDLPFCLGDIGHETDQLLKSLQGAAQKDFCRRRILDWCNDCADGTRLRIVRASDNATELCGADGAG